MASAKKISVVPEQTAVESAPSVNVNLFWQSTLFNEVYLQKDVPIFHKDVWVEDEVAFETFLNQFRNFCGGLEGEKPNSWSERTTINRFIKPMLEMLGYTSADNSNIDPFLEDEAFSYAEPDGTKTYKPDFIIVNNQKELKYIQEKKTQAKLEEARSSVILPIEAKYWDRIEEYRQNRREDAKRADKKDTNTSEKGMDFDEQCLKYMEMLNRPYGILTDGKTWRLYNLSVSTPNYKPFFQFNLGRMIKHVSNSDFLKSKSDYALFENEIKYFYFIFRKKALFSETGEELFVDSLLTYSKKYVSRVEEDLKERFVDTMSIACNGYRRTMEEAGEKTDLELIRNVAESHIFNILFLRYCEARGILPVRQDPDGYRLISISHMIDKLEGFEPERERDNLNISLLKRRFSDIKYDPAGTQLYDRLLKLTKVVQEGNSDEYKGFSIKGFKETIFSADEWKFVQKHKLSNQEMVCILFELGYSKSDIQGRKYQQIPYSSFSPRQLGSIYESFLEFKLEKADEDLAFIKRQWKPANLKSEKVVNLGVPTIKKGQLFFTPNNEERKATGSYYTPDPIVQMIVAETLQPLVKGKTAEELLKLDVCDPAMGSGHFLSATLNYIAKLYLEKVDDEVHDDVQLSLTGAKQRVLHSCIYGVDINPRAVKLAKLSLWMETADPAIVLEDLDDQL
jgi:type I restriction-modification system DNA methylase subunit